MVKRGRERGIEMYPAHLPGLDNARVYNTALGSHTQPGSQGINKTSHLCTVYLISEDKLKI